MARGRTKAALRAMRKKFKLGEFRTKRKSVSRGTKRRAQSFSVPTGFEDNISFDDVVEGAEDSIAAMLDRKGDFNYPSISNPSNTVQPQYPSSGPVPIDRGSIPPELIATGSIPVKFLA
jgi:hypothetical protein